MSSMPPTTKQILALTAFTLASAVAVLVLTSTIYMVDQGDYARTISRIFVKASPAGIESAEALLPTEWQFASYPLVPNPSSGTASFLFAVQAYMASSVVSTFDLRVAGVFAKLFVFGCALYIAIRVRPLTPRTCLPSYILICGFLVIFASEHNAAFLQSFYGEYALFMGLPLLIASLYASEKRSGLALLAAALVLCGGAKLQYFYLPGLVLCLYTALRVLRGRPTEIPVVLVLVLVQILVALPLLRNTYSAINSYHAAALGSHLVLSKEERNDLGFGAQQERCIGVDAWGNKIQSASSDRIVQSHPDCLRSSEISRSDSLVIYAKRPSIFLRLLLQSMPTHFTIRYFHLDARFPYVAHLSEEREGLWTLPGRISAVRERIVDWRVGLGIIISAIAISVAVVLRSKSASMLCSAFALLMLSSFAVSQVIISLLGEGVRDLSKHLAGAQLALEFSLLLAVLLGVSSFLRKIRPANASDGLINQRSWLVD